MLNCGRCGQQCEESTRFCPNCGDTLDAVKNPDSDPLIGKVIANNFRVDEFIGVGAMGRVYRAEQLSLAKVVALKMLHRHLLGDPNLAKRFHREARAASRLNHPNIISVIDFGNVDNDLYIAMEYLEGRDLGAILKSEWPLDPLRICRIMEQLLSALDEAHAAGVIHRDLKPDNIMLETRRTETDFVKVLDFGIAKVKDPMGEEETSNLTMSGAVCGTPEYMSPEQACGKELTASADLYSAGCILYHMLVGHPPFKAESTIGVITKHLNEPPIPPSQAAPKGDFPPALEALCLNALAKKPESRPPNPVAFLEEVVRIRMDLEKDRDETRTHSPGKSKVGKSGSGASTSSPSHTRNTPPAAVMAGGLLESGDKNIKPSRKVPLLASVVVVVVVVAASILGAVLYHQRNAKTEPSLTSISRITPSDRGIPQDPETSITTDPQDSHKAVPSPAAIDSTPAEAKEATAPIKTAKVEITPDKIEVDRPPQPRIQHRAPTKSRTEPRTKAEPVANPPAAETPPAPDENTLLREASVLFLHGDSRGAIRKYQKALKINPRNAEIHYELGRCYTRVKEHDRANMHYRKHLELNPNSSRREMINMIISSTVTD